LTIDNLVDFAVGNEITIAAIPWRTDVSVLHQNQRLRQRMAEEADLRGGWNGWAAILKGAKNQREVKEFQISSADPKVLSVKTTNAHECTRILGGPRASAQYRSHTRLACR